MEKGRKAVVISIFALVMLLILEAGFRLVSVNKEFTDMVLKPSDDLYWRLAWMAGRQSDENSEDLSPLDRYDATKGWTAKPGLRNRNASDKKYLNTNDEGFRGRPNFSSSKVDSITRIMILGDSFTFGDEVSDHETYAVQLQYMLPKTEVMNLGVKDMVTIRY